MLTAVLSADVVNLFTPRQEPACGVLTAVLSADLINLFTPRQEPVVC